jgi:excisionase family DNA binding protein
LNQIKMTMNIENKNVLTFSEALIYTGLKRSYMYKLTATGKIPHSKPNGKLIFFDRKLLDQWLTQNSKP